LVLRQGCLRKPRRFWDCDIIERFFEDLFIGKLDERIELARESINEGKAGQKLEKLIEETNKK